MVQLRDVIESEIEVFYAHQSDPEGAAMAAFIPRDRAGHAAHWERLLRDDDVITRTIVLDGDVAGNLLTFDDDDRLQVGYWIAREHWGKGVATAALAAFLDVVRERPLHAAVAKDNVASLRVLQKCGFEVRGEELGAPDQGGGLVEEYRLELPA